MQKQIAEARSERQIFRVQNAAARPPRDLFLLLAVAYLALPNVIFLASWIRPIIGLPAALVVVGAVVWLVWSTKLESPRRRLSSKMFGAVLAAAFLWTLVTGVGGVFPQSNDYFKHNLLFHDLATMSWPVKYSLEGGSSYLCYAMGYYLVPTLGGQCFGESVVAPLTFLWTFLGVALVFYWAATLTAAPVKTLSAILLCAMTGVVWAMFKSYGIPGIISAEGLGSDLMKDGLFFGYNDSYTRFSYQPQHALIGWLGAAVMYECLWLQKNPCGVAFIWALCLLWSPLTCVGLLLVPLAALGRGRWQSYFEPVNVLGGGVLAVVLGIYFQGHAVLPDTGFVGKFSDGTGWLFHYLLFLALNLSPVLFVWLVEWRLKVLGDGRRLLAASTILLILLPLYKMGFAADLRLQASSSALLLFALAVARLWQSEALVLKELLSIFLAVALLIGAIGPTVGSAKNLLLNSNNCAYENIVLYTGWQHLPDMRDPGFDVAAQYLGRHGSLAERMLLR